VFPELNDESTAGLVTGWTLYSVVLVVSAIIIFVATWSRNTEYTKDLDAARKRLRELGMNIDEIDREFEELQRGNVEEKETENFLDVALKEGQKIREGRGTTTDNKI